MRRTGCTIAACLALAGCATPQADDARSSREGDAAACFWPSQVSGFSDAGPDTALVRVGTARYWELKLSPGCPDVDWALRIGIRSRGGQTICPGRPAELVVPEVSGSGARPCLVRSIRRLSDAEGAAAAGNSPPAR